MGDAINKEPILNPNKTSPIERVATISVDGHDYTIIDTFVIPHLTFYDSLEYRNSKVNSSPWGKFAVEGDSLFSVKNTNGFIMK